MDGWMGFIDSLFFRWDVGMLEYINMFFWGVGEGEGGVLGGGGKRDRM